jgi:hypothetical protein
MKKALFKIIMFVLAIITNANAQHFDKPYPVSNYNSLYNIISENNVRFFCSPSGRVIYNAEKDIWSIDNVKCDSIKRKIEFKEDDRSFTKDIGFEADPGTYWSVGDSIVSGNNKYLLISSAGEGARTDQNQLYDLKEKTVYHFDNIFYSQLSKRNNYIYVTNKDGFTRINLDKKEAVSYSIIPVYNSSTVLFKDKNMIWLATDQLGIQFLQTDSSTVNYWTPNDITKKEFFHPMFTNFVKKGDDIIVGCKDVGCGGWLGSDTSYIFLYSLTYKTWKYITLSGVSGIQKILLDKDKIIIGCHHYFCFEGGDINCTGGLFTYDLSRNELIKHPEVESDDMVMNLSNYMGKIKVETYTASFEDNNKLKQYLLDTTTNTIKKISVRTLKSKQNIEYLKDKSLIPDQIVHDPTYETNKKMLETILIKPIAISRKLKTKVNIVSNGENESFYDELPSKYEVIIDIYK